MTPQRRTIAIVGAALFLLGTLAAGARVLTHERGEADRRSDFLRVPAALQPNVDAGALVLLAMSLEQGEAVDFEVCVRDRARAAATATDARIAVWPLEDGAEGNAEPLIDASLDETLRDDSSIANVDGASCLRFAAAPALGASGRFALGVRWVGDAGPSPALRALPLAGRIVVRRSVGGADRGVLALMGAGALLVLLGFARRSSDAQDSAPSAHVAIPLRRVGLALAVLAALVFAPAVLPLGGATLPFVFASILAFAQLVLAARGASTPAMSDVARRDALALRAPAKRAVFSFLGAPVAGVVLFVIGGVVQGLVARLGPAETTSAVERFVSWPSAALAVAAVALVAPLAEELFFRGFVYGALRARFGVVVAMALTTIAFVLPHLPQLWGAWGAIAALFVTSGALTTLRAATGSTLIPALAHLAHNALLAWSASA
jgi:membrane protease YdiL (CAAX protease family)